MCRNGELSLISHNTIVTNQYALPMMFEFASVPDSPQRHKQLLLLLLLLLLLKM